MSLQDDFTKDGPMTQIARRLNALEGFVRRHMAEPSIGMWTDWTPTLSATGAMTYTGTSIIYARYFVIGKLLHFAMRVTGTTGGTASTTIFFTPPVAPKNIASSTIPCVAAVVDGTPRVGRCYIDTNTGGGAVVNQVTGADGNYGLGAGRILIVSGFYEID